METHATEIFPFKIGETIEKEKIKLDKKGSQGLT